MVDVLVLCPHTDDEINMAGTIIRHIEDKDNLRLVAFSTGNRKTGSSAKEFIATMNSLGVLNFDLLSFETRYFKRDRQKILQVLCDEPKPDIVYCPTTWDIHQDHQVICQEVMRAFKNKTIYGYSVMHNYVLSGDVNYYVGLTWDQLDRKYKAAKCYVSQKERDYMRYDTLVALARIRGHQVGLEYAEAFQIIRKVKK